MRDKLSTDRGRKLYAQRKITIEPVFGQIKYNRHIDRFMRRGRSAAAVRVAASHSDPQPAQAPQPLDRHPGLTPRVADLHRCARDPSVPRAGSAFSLVAHFPTASRHTYRGDQTPESDWSAAAGHVQGTGSAYARACARGISRRPGFGDRQARPRLARTIAFASIWPADLTAPMATFRSSAPVASDPVPEISHMTIARSPRRTAGSARIGRLLARERRSRDRGAEVARCRCSVAVRHVE